MNTANNTETEQPQRKLNPQILDDVSLRYQTESNPNNLTSQTNNEGYENVNESAEGKGISNYNSNNVITSNPINFTLEEQKSLNLDIHQESEVIMLDKYYKQLLKSQKDEF